MKLSEIVKSYRIDNELSQGKFADRCGVSKAYISMIENEKNSKTKKKMTPNIASLAKIAKGMNIDLDALVRMMDKDIVISLKPIETEFSKEEMELIKRFRKLNADGRDFVFEQIEYALSKSFYVKKEESKATCS